MLDRLIEQITDEVEKRILKNLQEIKFNVEVTVSKPEVDQVEKIEDSSS